MKEIDTMSIPQKKIECIELLCLAEKELPTSFFDIQVHLLIHLLKEIEIVGVVSSGWTFGLRDSWKFSKALLEKKHDFERREGRIFSFDEVINKLIALNGNCQRGENGKIDGEGDNET